MNGRWYGVLLLSIVLAGPVWAHTPSASYQTGTYTAEHDSGGADHTHIMWVFANLASPVHDATYTRSYLCGSLPVQSGTIHKAQITTSRWCSLSVGWLGTVSVHGFETEATDAIGDENVEVDENLTFAHIFLLELAFPLGEAPGIYTAEAKAQMVDSTMYPNISTEFIGHEHAFEVEE